MKLQEYDPKSKIYVFIKNTIKTTNKINNNYKIKDKYTLNTQLTNLFFKTLTSLMP